jgi:hypothetical protein
MRGEERAMLVMIDLEKPVPKDPLARTAHQLAQSLVHASRRFIRFEATLAANKRLSNRFLECLP